MSEATERNERLSTVAYAMAHGERSVSAIAMQYLSHRTFGKELLEALASPPPVAPEDDVEVARRTGRKLNQWVRDRIDAAASAVASTPPEGGVDREGVAEMVGRLEELGRRRSEADRWYRDARYGPNYSFLAPEETDEWKAATMLRAILAALPSVGAQRLVPEAVAAVRERAIAASVVAYPNESDLANFQREAFVIGAMWTALPAAPPPPADA